MYSDAVDNGNELAQELRIAAKVALKLGREEMREEIIRALVDEGASLRAIGIARDTGKGNS
jgi:hypothetical protein